MAINIQVAAGERSQVWADFRSNIESNKASGREQLLSGNQSEFTGYPVSLVERLLQVSLEVDARSHYDFWRRVISPLGKIAAKLEEKGLTVPAIFAGEEDIPPHFTFTRAVTTSLSETESARSALLQNPDMQEVLGLLPGMEFTMDTFVAGNTSYICTSSPSDLLIGTRRVINGLARDITDAKDVQIVEYKLAQASSQRIIRQMSPAAGSAYLNESYKLEEQLRTDPVMLRVSDILFGSAADHIRGHRKELLLGT
jgi:hypothetical protein